MTRKSLLPQSRRHVHIYDEDWQYLASVYNGSGTQAIRGPNQAIREIVHRAVMRIRENENSIITKAKQQSTGGTIDG